VKSTSPCRRVPYQLVGGTIVVRSKTVTLPPGRNLMLVSLT
jgi:hypothetical protein